MPLQLDSSKLYQLDQMNWRCGRNWLQFVFSDDGKWCLKTRRVSYRIKLSGVMNSMKDAIMGQGESHKCPKYRKHAKIPGWTFINNVDHCFIVAIKGDNCMRPMSTPYMQCRKNWYALSEVNMCLIPTWGPLSLKPLPLKYSRKTPVWSISREGKMWTSNVP